MVIRTLYSGLNCPKKAVQVFTSSENDILKLTSQNASVTFMHFLQAKQPEEMQTFDFDSLYR